MLTLHFHIGNPIYQAEDPPTKIPLNDAVRVFRLVERLVYLTVYTVYVKHTFSYSLIARARVQNFLTTNRKITVRMHTRYCGSLIRDVQL